MIDYQSIRARYELAVRAALAPKGVLLHYDNVEEADPCHRCGG